jgi:hypothetical protein
VLDVVQVRSLSRLRERAGVGVLPQALRESKSPPPRRASRVDLPRKRRGEDSYLLALKNSRSSVAASVSPTAG